jgi:predicted nucleotidyltransferase
MRLHPWQAEAIREVVHAFDPAAHVYLFGSRVDDQARGGDIDLLVMSERIGDQHRTRLQHRLHERIGDQRIDLLIARDTQRPFVRLALAEAVEL